MYQYQPQGHKLVKIADGRHKSKSIQCSPTESYQECPCCYCYYWFIHKAKNPSWIYLEAGHVAQNICLQAVSLNIGTVTMAGFKPEEVKKALKLPDNEQPVYIMP